MAELLSVDEALQAVLARTEPLAGEPVAVEDAPGRVLAEPARALVDLPPFPSSAMDGFAVRADRHAAGGDEHVVPEAAFERIAMLRLVVLHRRELLDHGAGLRE